MKMAYDIEDWQNAVDQMINGKPAPDFGLDDEYLQYANFNWNLGRFAQKVPKSIEDYYGIFSDPAGFSQYLGFIQEIMAADFNSRPNALNPKKGYRCWAFSKRIPNDDGWLL